MPLNKFYREKNIVKNGIEFPFECLTRKEKQPHLGNLHFHRYIEILLCLKGKINVICGNDILPLNEGDFIYIAPNEMHTIEYLEFDSIHYCIKFDTDLLLFSKSLTNSFAIDDFVIYHLAKYELFVKKECEEFVPSINFIFEQAITNYNPSDYSCFLMTKSYIYQIMAFIIRKRCPVSISHLDLKLLEKIESYIDKNYSSVTLKDLAKYTNISYNYFSGVFLEMFGVNYNVYIKKTRVEKSIDMLLNTDLSISMISLECGFSSISHYIKCFKEIYSTTPYQYRKKMMLKNH